MERWPKSAAACIGRMSAAAAHGTDGSAPNIIASFTSWWDPVTTARSVWLAASQRKQRGQPPPPPRPPPVALCPRTRVMAAKCEAEASGNVCQPHCREAPLRRGSAGRNANVA